MSIQGFSLENTVHEPPASSSTQRFPQESTRVIEEERRAEESRQSERSTQQRETEAPTAPKMPVASSSTPLLSFKKDEKSGETYISVVDRQTKEELRQIPPEKLRELREFISELQGNVVDTIA